MHAAVDKSLLALSRSVFVQDVDQIRAQGEAILSASAGNSGVEGAWRSEGARVEGATLFIGGTFDLFIGRGVVNGRDREFSRTRYKYV